METKKDSTDPTVLVDFMDAQMISIVDRATF